jgi:hypothetical protein
MFCLQFTPYPLSRPAFLCNVPNWLGCTVQSCQNLFDLATSVGLTRINPGAEEDWGQQWVIKTIDKIEGRKPVALNIRSNTPRWNIPRFNVQQFQLIARESNSPVLASTSRLFTNVGDEEQFSERTALFWQWYLIWTADNDKFKDEASRKADLQITDFVEHSGRFSLIATKLLPDGSRLFLYRQGASHER